MFDDNFKVFDGKVIIRLKDKICDHSDELITSPLFKRILERCLNDLVRRNSKLMSIFTRQPITEKDVQALLETLRYLARLPANLVLKVVEDSGQFLQDRSLLNEFVEYVYNYWRSLQRFIVCDSEGDHFDLKPYRTFNSTVEKLTHLVRSTYRDIQENITGTHPRIYRQVRAGAEVATIALPLNIRYPNHVYKRLNDIGVIRQVLFYPPLIFNSPMNKRSGVFERVDYNPLERMHIEKEKWLCYPARVGDLLIMVYFSDRFFELGFALSNLFELAGEDEIDCKPDAVYLFGAPDGEAFESGKPAAIFYDDEENNILVAAVPERDEFAYFGYLKKMVLTLHNIRVMKQGRLPYHGAMVNLTMRGGKSHTILLMGDTGAGKSETLEALRKVGGDVLEDITIIADDMGSLCTVDERIFGYGTEIGAFVRLDDLQPGYAFGQIDRTILMNPNQVNARVVLPVTTFDNVVRGFPVDIVLYANNYEEVDAGHPLIERIRTPAEALNVFRDGAVMGKGTTTSTGLVHTYFANIFGPEQYQDLHEGIARHYFEAFFKGGVFVGQIRTQLGVAGMEHSGPEAAASALLDLIAISTAIE